MRAPTLLLRVPPEFPRRWTSTPFPPYAHRPGRTPHPVTDPRGHSFGAPHPDPAAPPPPEQWRACEAYLLGVDLFNHEFWWEAHEAWESCWRALPPGSAQARFLQSLIQVAAYLLKRDAGEEAGAARVLERARANLAQVIGELRRSGGERYMGLRVEPWLKSLDGPGTSIRAVRIELS